MTLLTNPYQFSNPVYRPEDFFNRQFTLNRLRQALRSRRSVQLVGQFRIGKSSLLRYVQAHLGEFVEGERTIAIYYDLSRRPYLRDGQDFFARMWQMMSHALVERDYPGAALSPDLDLTDPFEFDGFLHHWIEVEGFRFIFLLDEFGLIAVNENFKRDFFDNLRQTIPDLTYIVTAPRSLSNLTHVAARGSELWNVLQLIRVKLFSNREDIQALIHQPAERANLPWPDQAEAFIYERGGQHPCYIQMAAAALYDTYLFNQKRFDYRQADQIFRETAGEHFRYLWTRTLADRYRPGRERLLQQTLLDVAGGHPVDDGLAEELENQALIWWNEAVAQWEPLSAWFGDWLRRWAAHWPQPQSQLDSHGAETERMLSQPPSNFVLQPGQQLEGRYHIQEIVGLTNHSQVVRAWDDILKRMVAIKTLRLEQANYEIAQQQRENLWREARILAGLKHPNIGQVYTTIREPLGIVMEWVPGESFQMILDSGQELPAEDVIKLGLKLAAALSYAHQQGVIHRDLKPSNIILTGHGEPILIDFDIARASARETITRLADGSFGYVGTREYSAPEQFLDAERVGPTTDLFALGLILYELLTGQLPYGFGNLPSLYEAGHFPSPAPFDIPAPLYQIIGSLLQQHPEHRPASAALVRDRLKALLKEP